MYLFLFIYTQDLYLEYSVSLFWVVRNCGITDFIEWQAIFKKYNEAQSGGIVMVCYKNTD